VTAIAPVRSSRREPAIGLLVLIALAASALLPAIGPLALVVLVVAFVLSPRDSSLRWAAAAAMPVTLMFSWAWLVDGSITRTGLDCAEPVSPLAFSRILEAIVVIGMIALLARRLGSRPGDLGLRRPSRSGLLLGVLAVATLPLLSLVIGPILAEPFFGPMQLELAPAAIVPALALAVANGTMEELAYRGALMGWNSRVIGISAALVGQAAVFGLAHLGDDFVASPLPVMVAVGLGGLAAGLIARRTGSLFLPIVVHICVDVPLYFAIVCRFP
jgi:membrane protease YdiL (CAAX protease family)